MKREKERRGEGKGGGSSGRQQNREGGVKRRKREPQCGGRMEDGRRNSLNWTARGRLDYLLLYRSGNNGIPIMKWISLGSQWTSMRPSRDPTPSDARILLYRSPVPPTFIIRALPCSFTCLELASHYVTRCCVRKMIEVQRTECIVIPTNSIGLIFM